MLSRKGLLIVLTKLQMAFIKYYLLSFSKLKGVKRGPKPRYSAEVTRTFLHITQVKDRKLKLKEFCRRKSQSHRLLEVERRQVTYVSTMKTPKTTQQRTRMVTSATRTMNRRRPRLKRVFQRKLTTIPLLPTRVTSRLRQQQVRVQVL